MPKFKELKKTQRKVNKEIRSINKNLKEVKFIEEVKIPMINFCIPASTMRV